MEDRYTKRGIPENFGYEEAKIVAKKYSEMSPKFTKSYVLKVLASIGYFSFFPLVAPDHFAAYLPACGALLLVGLKHFSSSKKRQAINDGTFFKDRTEEQVVHFAKQVLLGNPELLESARDFDISTVEEEDSHVRGR